MPMLSRLRFILFLPLAALLACATAPSTIVTGTSSAPASGDYVITVAAGTASASTFTGNLTVAGTTVSGVFQYNNPGTLCVSGGQDIPFTGTYGNNVLTLTSAAFVSSVATLTIQLPLARNNVGAQIASGTAVITGGTCARASAALQAQLLPTYDGTWNVSLTSPSAGSATLNVVQSPVNADGQFPVTGTIAASGSACSVTATALTGLVRGATLQLSNTQSTITVSADNSAVPVTIAINGACLGTMTQ